MPESLHPYWFLGLVDGDGCFYKNPNGKNFKFQIASSFAQKWDYFENLMKKLDISYKVKRIKRRNGNAYSKVEITSRHGILKFGKYIYNSDIGLPRKRIKFEEIQLHLEELWKDMLEKRGISFRKKKSIYEIYDKNKHYVKRAYSFEEAKKIRDLAWNRAPC